uniref:Uncharacterized protein n=1 Tax=Anguilla anguilla TaxID=7936 RepID=A0A0E9RUJ2_ANGAN
MENKLLVYECVRGDLFPVGCGRAVVCQPCCRDLIPRQACLFIGLSAASARAESSISLIFILNASLKQET